MRWVHSVLKGDVFTGHSAKATLLSWLAKWGGPSEERTTLGHHALKDRKSLATYSRDFQAGPLRLLDRMLTDVRTKNLLAGFAPALEGLPIVLLVKVQFVMWGGRVHRNEILNITQFAFSCAFTENVLWGSASLFLISFLGCFFSG